MALVFLRLLNGFEQGRPCLLLFSKIQRCAVSALMISQQRCGQAWGLADVSSVACWELLGLPTLSVCIHFSDAFLHDGHIFIRSSLLMAGYIQ